MSDQKHPHNSDRPDPSSASDTHHDDEHWEAERDAADAMQTSPDALDSEAEQLHAEATQRLAHLTTEQHMEVSFGRQMLQLVLVPAILVAGIMGVWIMVTALSGRAEQVSEVLAKLAAPGGGVPGAQERYRSAVDLLSIVQSKSRLSDKDRKDLITQLPDIARQYLGKSDQTDRMILGCLGLLGEPATLPVFDEFLKSADEDDRFAAVSGLYLWRGEMDVLRPLLPEILKAHNSASKSVAAVGENPGSDYWLRLESISVLGAVAAPGDQEVIKALLSDTTDSSGANRELAWNAGLSLAVLGDPRGIPYVLTLLDRNFLQKQLEDPTKPDGPTMDAVTQRKVLLSTINVVVGSSASANGHAIRIRDESVWSAIRKLSDDDPDSDVRNAAHLALEAKAADGTAAPTGGDKNVDSPGPPGKEKVEGGSTTDGRSGG